MDSPGPALAPPPTTRLNQDLELMSWDELRREARKLESDIESKLTSYSKFGDAYARSSFLKSGDNNPEDSPAVNNDHISSAMAVEFEQLMMRLSEVNERMGWVISNGVGGAGSHMAVVLQQHRDKYQLYLGEYRKTKATINATREHAELLLSVRNDISSYKNNPRMDSLLRERSSVHSSDRIADAFISQGLETRDQLAAQNTTLVGSASKLSTLRGTFTSINELMGSIKRKRSRDCIILAVFTASLICFMLYWWLR